jgi:hypothetical protein
MKISIGAINMTDQQPSQKALYLREYRLKKKLAKEEEDKKLAVIQKTDERNWNKIKELEAKEDSLGREVLVDEDSFQDSCQSDQSLNDFINDKPKLVDNYKQFESDGESYLHANIWGDESSSPNKNKFTHQTHMKRMFGSNNRCED